MTFDKEFKEALSRLTSIEKDKIILRLLKKDVNFANRLYFELVDGRSAASKREEMEQIVKMKVKEMTENFYSVGYLMMDMRYLSGEISEHVRIAKDKFGEASLNLLMINEVLRLNNDAILRTTLGKSSKLCSYIVARTFKILLLIDKLHEDNLVDFKEGLEELGERFSKNDHLMRTAIFNGLDVNWVWQADFPEDLEQIHQSLRKQGYLKG